MIPQPHLPSITNPLPQTPDLTLESAEGINALLISLQHLGSIWRGLDRLLEHVLVIPADNGRNCVAGS